MKKYKFIILLLEDIVISVFFSLFLYSKNVVNTRLQFIFVLIYFMGMLFLLNKYVIKKNIVNLKEAIIGIVFSLVILGPLYNSFKIIIYTENKIEVVATGKKNEQSSGKEVWITRISVDGNNLDLSTIKFPENWYKKDGNIVCYPEQNEIALTLSLPKAKQIEINFMTHPWSGIVEIESGIGIKKELDLYGSETSSLVYETNGQTINSNLLFLLNIVSIFLIVFKIYAISIIMHKKSNLYRALISLLYSLVLFHLLEPNTLPGEVRYLLIIIHCYACIILMTKKYSIFQRLWILIASIFCCFLIFGSRIFILSDKNLITKVTLFCVSTVWVIPIVNMIIILFEKIERQLWKHENDKIKKSNCHRFIAILISVLLSSIYVTSIIQVFFYDTIPSSVYIKSSEDKNKNSQGYEILIGSIVIDGKGHTVSDLTELPPGWREVNGMTIGGGENGLLLEFHGVHDVKILFNKHQWSGIAQIYDGNKEVKIDLYSGRATSYINSYQITGNRFYNFTLGKSIIILTIFVLLLVTNYYIINLFSVGWNKNISKLKFYGLVLAIMFACLFPFLLASYPASLCVDSRTQLTQIYGWAPLTDAHPAVHTLLIKVILNLTGSILGVPLFQAAFFCLLGAGILTHLYISGINRKVLLCTGIILSISINNGIYTTTVWKDVPYSYFLLWLTFLVYRVYKDNNFIKKPLNLLAVSMALSGVMLFRHNGFVAYILVVGYLLLNGFKRKRWQYLVAVVGSIAVVTLIRGPVYNAEGVEKVETVVGNSTSSIPLLHGLVYANMEGAASLEVQTMLGSIMSEEDWNSCYTPYSANELFLSEPAIFNKVSEKVALIGTKKMLNQYISNLPRAFWQLLQDRLTGTDLLWNVYRDQGYDWRTANDSYEIGVVSNDFTIYRSDNVLTNILEKVYQITVDSWVLDSIFWRTGFWLLIAILTAAFLIINKRYSTLIILVPCLGNTISLLLGMAWQDYRYVYYLGLCTPIIILLCLSDYRKKDKLNKGVI